MPVTYAEGRQWIVWLNTFTARDLADSMGVHEEVAERIIKAALWHGIIEDSGDYINGTGPAESIYFWKPLPPGPTEAFTYPPEWKVTPGVGELAPPDRGMPVRIKIHDRRERSKPGQRHQIMLNERRYQAHVEALQRRKEAQKARAHKDPKWKVRKGNRRTGGGGQ